MQTKYNIAYYAFDDCQTVGPKTIAPLLENIGPIYRDIALIQLGFILILWCPASKISFPKYSFSFLNLFFY